VTGRVVYCPQGPHECNPGVIHKPIPEGSDLASLHPGAQFAVLPGRYDHPRGTVWKCDCGTTWVSQGLTGGGLQRSGGYAAAGLEWKRESKRARRKREREGIMPEQVFERFATVPPAPPPTVHHRDLTDRLKAAERCVLAIEEALTGEKHGGIYDYDRVREHLLSVIAALPCPAPKPASSRLLAGETRLGLPLDRLPGDVASALIMGGISGRYFRMLTDDDGTECVAVEDALVSRAIDVLTQAFVLPVREGTCPAPSPADQVE
jgi:hypothetical protein